MTHLWPIADQIEHAKRTARAAPVLRPSKSFRQWLEANSPEFDWSWRHLELLQEKLDKVTSGEITRLIISTPPQHGKSNMVTVRYPTYRLQANPKLRVLVTGYNQEHATEFSRQARNVAQELMPLAADSKAMSNWSTLAGGVFRARGIRAGITGKPGDLVIIDDPVKDRAEADSETIRKQIIAAYRESIYTRLQPGAAIIIIMTRWHEDDLVGTLIEEMSAGGEHWDVVNLPAICVDSVNDPLKRAVGEALEPRRFDVPDLMRIKTVLTATEGPRAWDALYQGNPQPAGGTMFLRDKFKIAHALPAGCKFIRRWDNAATEGGGDYTAGVLMALAPDFTYYVCDVVRGQWAGNARDEIIQQTAELDKIKYGFVHVRGVQDPGSAGVDAAAAFIRLLNGFSVDTERESGEKKVRAAAYSSQQQAGNVRLIAGLWNALFTSEHTSFPTGRHDDQVDAAAGAYNYLAALVVQWVRF
ncbi:MAG: phage terminase large subunit [Pyrinomonadaceae bacterium MAG19_C2-C3]|nr:phage terminase large subunit [Pyrinomonadaceae bacterium MAG19_C2-C3]